MKNVFLFSVLLAVVVSTGGCASRVAEKELAQSSQTSPQAGNAAFFEIYLASDMASDVYSRKYTDFYSRAFYVASTPFINTSHLQGAFTRQESYGTAIVINLTESGSEIMKHNSDSYLNHRVAVFSDGRLLAAPYVLSQLSSQVAVMPQANGLRPDEVDSFVARINALASENR